MVHELAHMWFGDSVSPYEWSDLWLNEGHATWYEFLFAAENGQLEEDIGDSPTSTELMQVRYSLGDIYRALPRARRDAAEREPGRPVQSQQPYYGGALVLYALRQQVGNRVRERSSASGSSATATRSRRRPTSSTWPREVSHRDLTRSCSAWLYDTDDAADAGPPGLDGRSGRPGGPGLVAAPAALTFRQRR